MPLIPLLLATDIGLQPTREILGNVPSSSRWIFALLATISLGFFFWGCWRRIRIWRLGRRATARIPLRSAAVRFVREIVLQKRVRGRGIASVGHLLLFSGFSVLLIGTLLIAVEHLLADLLGRPANAPVFHYGLYYIIYEFVLDTFGVALIVGCLILLVRRCARPKSLDHRPLDVVVLLCLLFLGISGYFVEGLRILLADTGQSGCSFVGLATARLLAVTGIDKQFSPQMHLFLWWLHAIPALVLVAAFPYTRLLHSIAGSLNLLSQPESLGQMIPVRLEEVEETGRVGVGRVVDFSRERLLHLDACVACGRCEEACPAQEAGKPLSPKAIVLDVRQHIDAQPFAALARLACGEEGKLNSGLHGDVISAESLWSCTTCAACVDICPLRVSPLGMITDMRRHLIGEGELRGAPAMALQKTQRSGNPWGLPQQDRFDWANGLDVPTVKSVPDFEYLYWVGCAASYDRRVQRVARSMVWLLTQANVRFAVLGTEERCTGESARRMGDEFVFQELAATNIEVLKEHSVRKIVTHCPHCLNSLENDYSQLGGDYEVVHHSVLLASLIESGRLPQPSRAVAETITYHDPCYLARTGGITEPPRALIQTATGPGERRGEIAEMPRHARETSCCGGGGGRMWFDDSADERIGRSRVAEAVETGADTLAVSCPFCLIMLKDGIADAEAGLEIRDVAEILAASLGYEQPDRAGGTRTE
ncbi:MAG: (Fe-S)-binding protein [Pirellulales bacterium]|nr:(Fe-S)-binding protein [Pirellulales bacterium]